VSSSRPDGALPVAVTLAADQITNNTARLNGQANPGGRPRLACSNGARTPTYGNLTAPQAVGSGLSLSNVSAVLNGLLGQSYHYRLVASNAFAVAPDGPVFTSQASTRLPSPACGLS